jgi:PAS domain S-box-containing protein
MISRAVLIVDDHMIIGISLAKVLEAEGYTVHLRSSGEDAIAFLGDKEHVVDLIVMDIDLGSPLDGVATAEVIQQIADIPIIFISLHTEPSVIRSVERVRSYGIIPKQSGEAVLLAAVNAALTLHDSEVRERESRKALDRSEARFRAAFEKAAIGIAFTNLDGTFSRVNGSFCEILGRQAQELVGRHFSDFTAPDDLQANRAHYHDLVYGSIGRMTFRKRYVHKNGHAVWAELSVSLIRDDAGAPVEFVTHVADISSRVLMEENLILSQRISVAVFEKSGVPMMLARLPGGEIVDVNDAFARMFEYSRNDVIGKTSVQIGLFSDTTARDRHIAEVLARGYVHGREVQVPTRSGVKKSLLINVDSIDIDGSMYTVNSAQDITGIKEAQRDLSDALREKDTLMKELQHRVKNNLHIVSGLLGLELPDITDPGTRRVLQNAQGRIHSLVVLYEQLYATDYIASVDLRVYLENLAERILDTYESSRSRILLETDVADCHLDLRRAVPLGLILNEALTNSLKYAFPENSPGKVSVRLEESGTLLTMIVSDNGKGLPSVEELRKKETLGLKLIRLLTGQIEGTLNLTNDGGAVVSVAFEKAAKAVRE